MNLTQMERIILIAELGNITEAARKLYVSQPSLSQTLTIVEQEIGASIFDRRTWPLTLTPEGEYFIRAAKKILSTNASMLEQIHRTQSGVKGTITIGASIPRCRNMMPYILPTMTEQYPNVTLSFVDGLSRDFEQMILFGNVDLAVSNIPPNSSQVGCYKLNGEKYYLVTSRCSEFARRLDGIRSQAGDLSIPFSLREAAGERFILLHPTRNSRIVFNRMCREINLTPLIAIETDNSSTALEFVEAELGIAIFASTYSNLLPFPYQTDSLSFFEIDSRYTTRDLYLYYDSEQSMTSSMKYFIRILLDSFGSRKSEQDTDES